MSEEKKIRKVVLIMTTLFMFFLTASVSHGTQYWAKTYGGTAWDYAFSIQQISDSRYLVAGIYAGTGGGVLLLKLNGSGTIQWQKTYGDTSYDLSRSAQQTSDNGFIVLGHTFISYVGGVYEAIRVLKLDSDGNIQWQKLYGGAEIHQALAVQQTNDSGYIVTGRTESFFGAGSRDILLLKLNSSGIAQWQRAYGGTSTDQAFSVQDTSDNGFIVAGHTYSFGAGYSDFWILKLDSNGTVQWQKTYGGTYNDGAYSVRQTNDSGYIVAGRTSSFGVGDYDVWVLKLDSSGIVQWQKTYGGNDYDQAYSVRQTNDSGYIVVGLTDSFGAGGGDIWILKLDSSGIVQWQKTYGGTDYDKAFSVQQTSESGYIVAGSTESFGVGSSDIFVLKLDSGGNVPECNLVGISDALVTETTVVGQSSSYSVNQLPASSDNEVTLPQNTSAAVTITCFDDGDSIMATEDNCPQTYNPDQLDTLPPDNGNGCGDACECEGNFDNDDNQDGSDAATFKLDFGRSIFLNPCINSIPCNGDFDCDGDCDGTDAAKFKEDFGRSSFINPCPSCPIKPWCIYP